LRFTGGEATRSTDCGGNLNQSGRGEEASRGSRNPKKDEKTEEIKFPPRKKPSQRGGGGGGIQPCQKSRGEYKTKPQRKKTKGLREANRQNEKKHYSQKGRSPIERWHMRRKKNPHPNKNLESSKIMLRSKSERRRYGAKKGTRQKAEASMPGCR